MSKLDEECIWSEVRDSDCDTDSDLENADNKKLVKEKALFVQDRPEATCHTGDQLYLGISAIFLCLHSSVGGFALWALLNDEVSEDKCTDGLVTYLTAATVHSIANVIFLTTYIIRLGVFMVLRADRHKVDIFDASDYILFLLESVLACLLAMQVGLGFLGEAWVGGIGILQNPVVESCSALAPDLVRHTKWVAVSENWALVTAFVAVFQRFL